MNNNQPSVETSTWYLSTKLDLFGKWIDAVWVSKFPDVEFKTIWVSAACVNDKVLTSFDPEFELAGDYAFAGYQPTKCPVTARLHTLNAAGDVYEQSGAFLHQFIHKETQEKVEILVLSGYYYDDGNLTVVACVPQDMIPTWRDFMDECHRILHALTPRQDVIIIGGVTYSFVPTVEWDDIILPQNLKDEIRHDVDSFFSKGVGIYKRLNLKPFRKLLLAGVPGTGKTMLCSAIAKWAIEREFLVIYVSSADQNGSNFNKIQQAMMTASRSSYPAIILLEEFDAYLHEAQKALVLNVLDGSEAVVNEHGTLLIATTNYPEAIDERVYKRPGRLDRIYVIPEVHNQEAAEKMLRLYLGEMWHDDHLGVALRMVGYPGAFVREVAIASLTMVAYDDLSSLSVDLLEDTFNRLSRQIEDRDRLMKRNGRSQYGIPVIAGD